MPVDGQTINKIFTTGYNEFTILYDEEIKKFKSFNSFKKFIKDELEFWGQYLDNGYQGIHTTFNRINIELKAIDDQIDSEAIESRLNNIKSISRNMYFIQSDTHVALFLTQLFAEDKISARVAIDFLLNQSDNIPNIQNKRNLKGV